MKKNTVYSFSAKESSKVVIKTGSKKIIVPISAVGCYIKNEWLTK